MRRVFSKKDEKKGLEDESCTANWHMTSCHQKTLALS